MQGRFFSTTNGIIFRQQKNSIAKELFRKSIHICSSFIPFFLQIAYWHVVIGLTCICIFYCICELFRLKGKEIPLISKVTEVAARKRDENKFILGPVTLVIGILCAAIFFPLENARLGIFALAFGDGLASVSGKLFGKTHIPFTKGKTIVGSLTCFFAVFISLFCVTKNFFISLILAFITMFVELLPLKDFDNILIPIIVSFVSTIL